VAELPTPPGVPPDPEQTDLLPTSSARPDAATTDFALAPDLTPTSPPAAQIPASIGRYRIDREIARGGMGSVLCGRDPDFGRDVAVKLLLPAHQAKPVYRQRFLDEARITALLQHPGTIPVYELGTLLDGRPFFVMQFVAGQTLDSLLAARKHPADDLPRFLGVFERVCQTIAYAHSLGVIHRDLKPLNVMVAPFGVVKVMDWGVAKVLAEGESAPTVSAVEDTPDPAADTKFGSVLGTPAYMAPEQAHGDTALLDRRTDVFGLGGLLCAILTGHPPYLGKRTRYVYARASRGDLSDAFARLDASPAARELVALAKWCLASDPLARPKDASEVTAALTAYFESDLKRAERDLVRFFELTPDLFCIAGFDGHFRRVNANFTRVLGYPPAELISRPWSEFVHPDDLPGTQAEAEKVYRGLPIVHFRNRFRDVRGNYRWFEWSAKSIPEESVLFAVARDITDLVELEARTREAASGFAGADS
jgi:PAS domain S-box-containing protein